MGRLDLTRPATQPKGRIRPAGADYGRTSQDHRGLNVQPYGITDIRHCKYVLSQPIRASPADQGGAAHGAMSRDGQICAHAEGRGRIRPCRGSNSLFLRARHSSDSRFLLVRESQPGVRSSRRSSLPAALRGNESTHSMRRGHLKAASRAAQKSRTSCSVGVDPFRRLTKRRGLRPTASSGTPTTAASSTVGVDAAAPPRPRPERYSRRRR